MRSWWVDIALLLAPKQIPAVAFTIRLLVSHTLVSSGTVWSLLPVEFCRSPGLHRKAIRDSRVLISKPTRDSRIC